MGHRLILKFIYDCYRPSKGAAILTRFTLDDVQSELCNFPKSLLLGGEADPIFKSTLRGYEILREKGFECALKTYPSTHAFLGMPCPWPLPARFQQSSVDCLQDILAYLRDEALPT